MDKKQYDQLCETIWYHNKLYYVDHAPEISDEEYDHLLKKLEAIEKQHPEWISSTSPTQRVGEMLTQGFKTEAHRIPMLSLPNTYNEEELKDFLKRIEKLTHSSKHNFTAELKMDGIAMTAIYEKGVLQKGLTRGDGFKGDLITSNLRAIASLPLKLHGAFPDYLEARGEVFMPHKQFKRLNDEKIKAGEEPWANPRNAAAGSLKLLDPKETARRHLSVAFYGIAEGEGTDLKFQHQVVPYLKSLGLPPVEHQALCHNLEEIMAFAEKIRELRPKLGFDIDGIVIKLDALKEQQHLGAAGKNPRWAVAYKFAAEQAKTKILDITVQVGRTGVLTPVAELEPVFLAGSTIARATLHNQEEVERKDIRIHDTVTIEKGGDVIPKVVSVDLEARPKNSKAWKMPSHCPACGALVQQDPGEVAVRCPNSVGCPEQGLRRIIYFASKEAMDIDNLGEKVAEQLFIKGFVKTVADIYQLTAKELSELDGFKEKSIENLLTAIEKSKHVSLARFIMALGIKHIGSQTAELLALKAETLNHFLKLKYEDLLTIEGIGPKVAKSVEEYLMNTSHLFEIERLIKSGVKPESPKPLQFQHHPFAGKTFVLTGTLEKFTRSEAAALIKERGGKVLDAVSKKTDYLVVGTDPGSKLEKAKKLSIVILTEEEFSKKVFAYNAH